MMIDDSEWFAAQKRIRQEMAVEVDELRRIYPQPVKSDFELEIRKEVEDWMKKQPADKFWVTPGQAYEQFWNERLN
jgi:hypothetical protein